MLLKQLTWHPKSNLHDETQFPFNLSWVKNQEDIIFKQPVTFIVGDNGVGKSTLLESLAMNCGSIILNNDGLEKNKEYDSVRQLSEQMKTIWTYRTKSGFFFRADDFITFIRDNKDRLKFAEEELERIDNESENPNIYERIPYANTIAAIKNMYPKDLNELSHGQSFLALFKSRLKPKSLYFLDEPETPLSPQNQLSLLYMIHEQSKKGAQFVISTHSPILMAYPEAEILELTRDGFNSIDYDDVEHVQFMKSFMADPKRFMHYTFNDL